MLKTEIDEMFRYHAPNEDQARRYERLRDTAKLLAYAINECTSAGADQTAAIRKLRECVMTANAAIALEPRAQVGLGLGVGIAQGIAGLQNCPTYRESQLKNAQAQYPGDAHQTICADAAKDARY